MPARRLDLVAVERERRRAARDEVQLLVPARAPPCAARPHRRRPPARRRRWSRTRRSRARGAPAASAASRDPAGPRSSRARSRGSGRSHGPQVEGAARVVVPRARGEERHELGDLVGRGRLAGEQRGGADAVARPLDRQRPREVLDAGARGLGAPRPRAAGRSAGACRRSRRRSSRLPSGRSASHAPSSTSRGPASEAPSQTTTSRASRRSASSPVGSTTTRSIAGAERRAALRDGLAEAARWLGGGEQDRGAGEEVVSQDGGWSRRRRLTVGVRGEHSRTSTAAGEEEVRASVAAERRYSHPTSAGCAHPAAVDARRALRTLPPPSRR